MEHILLDRLQSTDFTPHLNETFHICLDGIEPTALELTSVTELGEARRPGRRKPFSLQFLGPVSRVYLLQRTYRLEHERFGALDLFIVPLGPQQGRMRYEAIFA